MSGVCFKHAPLTSERTLSLCSAMLQTSNNMYFTVLFARPLVLSTRFDGCTRSMLGFPVAAAVLSQDGLGAMSELEC